MKKLLKLTLVLPLLLLMSCSSSLTIEKELNPSMMLWYNQAAASWSEALPLGNGRLGAMVYGGPVDEIIQFNEETLWTGQPHDYAHEGAYEVLDEMRQLLWDGKQDEAHKLGNERFMSQPFGQLNYQPFGNVRLHFSGHDNPVNYNRLLDLEDAISSVRYEIDDIEYRREVFASEPDQAVLIRLAASQKGALEFTVGLDSPHSHYEVIVEEDELVLRGKANNYPNALDRVGKPYPDSKLIFEARLKVETDGGELVSEGDVIKVTHAKNATLYLVAATSFIDYQDISGDPSQRCEDDLHALETRSYKDLRKRHIEDFQELMGRVNLDLGSSELSERPTNERLISFQEDEDPSLVSLLYQYGRYLLISSSRAGTQPANLQGIWNDRLSPPWDSKYTININTEMNYWPAEITNLSELSDPLD